MGRKSKKETVIDKTETLETEKVETLVEEQPSAEVATEDKQLFVEQSVPRKAMQSVNLGGGIPIDSEKLESTGMMQEMNRNWFHPLGMELRPIKSGKTTAYLIVDKSDSMAITCIDYGKAVQNGNAIANVEKFQKFSRERMGARRRAIGYDVQPVR